MWCPTPGFLDDFHYPSIENLNLDIKILFSGDDLPSALKTSSELLNMKTKIKTLIDYDEEHPDTTIEDSVKKIILNIDFECDPTFYFGFVCRSNIDKVIEEKPELGKFFETSQEMSEGAKLGNRMAGYSLRVNSRGVIHHISATGIFMVFGFFFVATLLVKEILVIFAGQKEIIDKQRHNDLYVDHHIKDD